MTVWLFESNLMWSAKLRQSLRMLGHESVVLRGVPEEGTADAAVVNLGEGTPGSLIALLNSRGIPTVAHAGHREKELHELGQAAGATMLATNSEITHKLPEILKKLSEN